MWLKEKLCLIMPPANPLRFKPRQWKSRALQHPESIMTEKKWREFFNTRSDDYKIWVRSQLEQSFPCIKEKITGSISESSSSKKAKN